MKLNELSDNSGARKKRMRVGRGEGSGKGKTCGSGVKGQKSRTGVSINGFEGGQNPLYRRLPKRGFDNSMFETKYQIINIQKIEQAILMNRIDAQQVITPEVFLACGLVKNFKNKIKLLGSGKAITKMNLEVHAVSVSARASIEEQNGTITLL